MVPLGDEAQVELVLALFVDSANLDLRLCTVCVERTIGSEIILDAPMELVGGVSLVESLLFPFGDSVSIGAR
jgi:hypothetical protein